jgi:D-psicose/D-tagatose/L-ribulose 3-epimerase
MGGRRIGIEIFYWMDRWSDDQSAQFHKAHAAGYDGVEISLVAGVPVPVDRIQAESERHGLEVVCSTGLSPDRDVSSPDPQIRRAGLEHLTNAVKTAAQLGSPILGGVTYAPWLQHVDHADLPRARERSARALHEVAQIAGDHGLDLCVEVLNRFETNMFNTVDEALTFLDMVDHPAAKIELDTFHMNIEEEDLGAAVRRTGSRLGHVQCAGNARRAPQHGHIDWDAIRAGLDEVGYEGWIVFETFPNPDTEAGRTTYTWRHLADDLDSEARDAAEFLRRRLA